MVDAISRLRESKRNYEEQQHQEGFKAGEEWASEKAEAEELMRLKDWQTRSGGDWEVQFRQDENFRFVPSDVFMFEVWPDDEDEHDFWEELGHEKNPLASFVQIQ